MRAAVLLAGGLLFVLPGLAPAQAVEGPEPDGPREERAAARGIDRVCPPPAEVHTGETPSFDDAGTTHAAAISCAAGYRLVGGFDDGTFRPGQPVTRAQTASVVAAWLELATGFALDVPDTVPFDDVEGTHADAVAALVDIQVVSGRNDGTFGPGEPLTRGQFSRVVANAISYADVFSVDGPLPAAPDPELVVFDDVTGSTFEDDILALAAAGITTGTGDGRFSPGEPVTRGQLTTFLLRAADFLERHQRWKPTARTAALFAELVPPGTGAGDDADDADGDEAGTDRPTATVSVLVNAFDSSLAYLADLTKLPSELGPDATLQIRSGTPEDPGSSILTLADGVALAEAMSGERYASGSHAESDSTVRYADLVLAAPDLHVELRSEALPGGVVRGRLHLAE